MPATRRLGRRASSWSALCSALFILAACAAQQVEEPVVTAPEPEPEAAIPASANFTPDTELFICPRIRVQNAPPADDNRQITTYAPFVEPVDGVLLAVAPTNGGCLSSGFGPRNGKLHKGIDLQSRPASMIVSAADGVIAQAKYRKDYGNMVLIDHGDGVFTRYAHLVAFEPGVAEGSSVAFGQALGVMGNTSAFRVALHLHYEILVGNLDNPKGAFGLTPIDPFALEQIAAN